MYIYFCDSLLWPLFAKFLNPFGVLKKGSYLLLVIYYWFGVLTYNCFFFSMCRLWMFPPSSLQSAERCLSEIQRVHVEVRWPKPSLIFHFPFSSIMSCDCIQTRCAVGEARPVGATCHGRRFFCSRSPRSLFFFIQAYPLLLTVSCSSCNVDRYEEMPAHLESKLMPFQRDGVR